MLVSPPTTFSSLPSAMQILSEFLDAFQKQSRPVEQLVQAASLLILPMLEAGYDAGENVVDEESLTTMVNTMFDQQDGASSASALSVLACGRNRSLTLSPVKAQGVRHICRQCRPVPTA